MDEFLTANGWSLVHTLRIPPRQAELLSFDDLPITEPTKRYLSTKYPKGIYKHQKEAIQRFLDGKNLCITTGTASGKSQSFYVAAIEQLRHPSSRVMAIYPLKALGKEQEERWADALTKAGIPAKIGRIDGQVHPTARLDIIRNSKVLVLTPDIIHAWVLPNLSDRTVLAFLRSLSLVVVDEVHAYTGVFGSNAAFLFRRIQHVLSLLRTTPRWICASATLADANGHVRNLLGIDCTFVGEEFDTSPRHEIEVQLVVPPRSADFLTEISNLLRHQAKGDKGCFLAFVDSRKQTEQITSILGRSDEKEEENGAGLDADRLGRLGTLPYRAGYEERDRSAIHNRLTKGTLRGVVSTSALELGIDIPFVDTGVLIGVPRSSTSLYQRIGRVGRHQPGKVMVVSTGNVYDEAVFRKPESILSRPVAEAALYLENSRIQYIHALCLARHGGEHDQICAVLNVGDEVEFSSAVSWPEGFLDLCQRERLGEVPVDLQSMKAESGEDPNHTYPLRDVESQFKVELKQGPDVRQLGSLSHAQLLREAYPGAVYYYLTQPFRVYRVNMWSKLVQVRSEKRYTNRPQTLPTLVFPNLTFGNVYQSRRHDDLTAVECNLQIRDSLSGFKERRGPNEFVCSYPIDEAKTGVYFNQPRFTRNYFTTGVIISHPVLDRHGVDCDKLAEMLYESFLMLIPFERQDVNFGVDKYRAQRGPLQEGSKFLAIYDQTYGSLRLSARLLQGEMLNQALQNLEDLLNQEDIEASVDTVMAARQLYESSLQPGSDVSFDADVSAITGQKSQRVILPGSKGLNIGHNNEEFEVEAVFYHPGEGLAYRGKNASTTDPTVTDIVPIQRVVEIPGESKVGFYNYDTGQIESGPG